jgi:PAS domain S-box-containing protein
LTTARLLRSEGYEVFEAKTGADALALAAQKRPELIMLDRVLPDMDGIEVCARIKQAASLAGIKVVLTSGLNAHVTDRADGLDTTGADGYITRPLPDKELIARVTSFVRQARPSAAPRRRAEPALRGQSPNASGRENVDFEALLHEIEVHQAELEMQNSELRSAQRKLEQERDHYYRLYHNAPVGYAVLDDKAVIQAGNLTLAEMIGIEIAALTGTSFVEFVAPEHRDTFLGRLRAFYRDARGKSMQLDLVRADGTTLPVQMSDSAVEHQVTESAAVVHVALTDASGQAAAESARRTSETRLREAERIARLGHFVYDADAGVLVPSTSLCSLLGISPTQPLDLAGMQALHHPDDRAGVEDWLRVCHQASVGAVHHHDYRIVRQNGRVVHVRAHGRVEGGTGARVVATVQDTTESRQLRASLAQADRLSSMGLLAAGVAHEINNPLGYVLANLEHLGDHLPRLFETAGNLPEPGFPNCAELLSDLLKALDAAIHGTRRIRDTVHDLNTFSRVEADTPAPVDVNRCLDVAINMAAHQLKHRARLVRDYGTIPAVCATEGRLAQVFLNLLINAGHAIGEGNAKGNQIRVRSWSDGTTVCASVSDTGRGIPIEHQDKLFEPFFTTKQVGVGSGLGLPISRSLVERFGGSIEVESELGAGTKVTVRLPAETSVRAALSPRTLTGRVLVIDDEDLVRTAMCRVLADFDAVAVAGVAEARTLLENDTDFDAILCDIMMPGGSGTELHAWLRDHHPRLARHTVFITGGAFTPRTREYLRSTQHIALEKSCGADRLKQVVAEIVLHARAATE